MPMARPYTAETILLTARWHVPVELAIIANDVSGTEFFISGDDKCREC